MKKKITRKILAMLLTLAMLLSMIPSIFATDLPFSDVSEKDWFCESVGYVYENELMNGISATEFDPDGTVTRAMLVTVLYRLAGAPETDIVMPFTDVPENTYYAEAVKWAVANEITMGVTATEFAPENYLTREQLATFIYRYAVKNGTDVSAKGDLNVFPDGNQTSPFALEAVQWAVGFGLINGEKTDTATYLLPLGNATRAQIAAILMRFVEGTSTEEVVIKLFETTDIHGYIVQSVSAGYQYRLAYLADVFNDARADESFDDVILLDGGDIYQGTALSNLTYGNAIRAAFDVMDYDAVGLGNHEFDWDVKAYAADEDGTIPAYELGDYTGDSDIPVLAFNLYDAGTTNRSSIVRDYTILEKAGHKIAVIGYIPDYTLDIMASKIDPYDIDPDFEKLTKRVEEINEAEEPTAIIILAHDVPEAVAEAMDPELVDLVLGGHDHRTNNGVASNGVAFGQGGQYAEGYMATTLTIDAEGNVSVETPEYISILDDTSVLMEGSEDLDPEILDISNTAIDMLAEKMNEVLGYVDRNVSAYENIEGSDSTVAGNWMAGLMLDATKDLNTVAAFTNTGGIRCDFMLEEGATTRNITVGDIYQISPFSNRLLTFDLTGAQFAAVIESIGRNYNYGDQMSGFVAKYYVNEDGSRTVFSIVLDDGTVVDVKDTTKTYRVVVNEYCATLSGSVFEFLTPVQDYNAAPIDNQAAIESLRAIAAANDGYLPLDLTPRLWRVEAPVEAG